MGWYAGRVLCLMVSGVVNVGGLTPAIEWTVSFHHYSSS